MSNKTIKHLRPPIFPNTEKDIVNIYHLCCEDMILTIEFLRHCSIFPINQ